MDSRANYKQRRIYWKAINRIRAGFVRKFRKVWKDALIAYLEEDNDLAITEAMQETYMDVAGKFARSQRDRLIRRRAKAQDFMDDELDKIITQYVRDNKGQAVRSIQETSARLYATITADELLSSDEKIKAIDKMIVARARFLAQQEITSASNYGDMLGAEVAEQFGILNGEDNYFVKTWVATIDSVVRDAHADADGQTVRLREEFIVGGVNMSEPHDPKGGAENVINCRCTMIVDKIKQES